MRLKPYSLILALLVAFFLITRFTPELRSEEERMLNQLKADFSKPELVTHAQSMTQTNPEQLAETQATDFFTPLASCDRLSALRPTTAPVSNSNNPSLGNLTLPLTTLKAASRYATAAPGYQPREELRLAHPSNYGNRYQRDASGQPVTNEFIVVLHETVYSADSAINYFRTPHVKDEDQASYHTIIRRDGTIVYIVPPEKRAFGAGNSVFMGARGPEAVKTDRKLPPSVNNFAYHTSLETPADGANDGSRHSGYTEAQYQSLGWLLARTSIPETRITTHKAVDRSGTRKDPRSFNRERFLAILRSYPRQIRTSNACPPEMLASREPAA